MIISNHIDHLRRIVGEDSVLSSKEELVAYSYDATPCGRICPMWSYYRPVPSRYRRL